MQTSLKTWEDVGKGCNLDLKDLGYGLLVENTFFPDPDVSFQGRI